jgi:DNA-cytosine methyltransferase
MNTTSKPDRTLVSLFAGCGGSSLGYKQAGFDIRLAVEWDSKATDIYHRNFPETSIFSGDIADLTAEEALEITGLEPGELDVLDGSPPCQGFSTAGRRKYEDSRNRLFEEYVRMIDVFRPKMLVMENVSGLRKGKMKLMFAEMTIALKEAGYKVSCRELNAWWYGVPQDRRRLIWIGVRDDLDIQPGHPAPTAKRPVSVRDALEDLSHGVIQMRNPDFENKWKDGDGVGPTLMSTRPPTISIDTNGYGKAEDLIPVDRPSTSLRASQKPQLRMDGGVGVKGPGFKEHLRSLNEPGPTLAAAGPPRITGSFTFPCNADRDGKTIDQPVGTMAAIRPPSVTDGQTIRYLTIEESKILQGFPDWFDLNENEYKFIGNSVCPPMAEAIGGHLISLLDSD